MKSFGFTAVVASFSAFRCGAIQIPENTPPRMWKPRWFAECDVFFPPNLVEKSLRRLLCPHMKQVFVHIESKLFSGLGVRWSPCRLAFVHIGRFFFCRHQDA